MGTVPYFSSASGINNYIGNVIGTKIFNNEDAQANRVSYSVSGSYIYYMDNNYLYRENDYDGTNIDSVAINIDIDTCPTYYFSITDSRGIVLYVDRSYIDDRDTGNIYIYDIDWEDLSYSIINHYTYTPVYNDEENKYFCFDSIVEASIYSNNIGVLIDFYNTYYSENIFHRYMLYRYTQNSFHVFDDPDIGTDYHLGIVKAISPGNGKICFLINTFLYDWFYPFVSGYLAVVDVVSNTINYTKLPESMHDPAIIGDYFNEPYDIAPNFYDNTLMILTKYHYWSYYSGTLYYYQIYKCTYSGTISSVYRSDDEWDSLVGMDLNKLFYSNNKSIACRYYNGNLYFYDLSSGFTSLFLKPYDPYTAMSATIDDSDNSIIYFVWNGATQYRMISKIYLNGGNEEEIIDVNSISGMPDIGDSVFDGIYNLRLANNFITYSFFTPESYYYTIVHYTSSGSIIPPGAQRFQIIWWGGD
jgi:hypothetical protein